MFRFSLGLLFAAGLAVAGDDDLLSKIQIHGNLAQGFLFSSANNYLTADSSDGTARWTEGAISFSSSVTDQLRVGIQFHSYSLGSLGKQKVNVDWAFGDYKVKSWFGVRAGKLKTPKGLFNDIQDIDAVYQWALLPQSVYPADFRSFNLSHTGGTVYGSANLPHKWGALTYQGYAGARSQDPDEGFVLSVANLGISANDLSGPTLGADLRWATPVDGLTFGASYSRTHLSQGNATIQGYPLPIHLKYGASDVYAQYEKNKLSLSAEWEITAANSQFGTPTYVYTPVRQRYVMASYHVAPKVAVGSYFSEEWQFANGNRNRQDPANYQKDVTVNTRYDISQHLYIKLEGHYIMGTAGGLYTEDNPKGLDRLTKLALARVGFDF